MAFTTILPERPFTLDDLKQIEVKMAEIIDRDEPFEKEIWDRDYAIRVLKKREKNIRRVDKRFTSK